MIAYLKGTVSSVAEGILVLDVRDVGYRICISARDMSNISGLGQEIKVHIWMSVTQDAVRLYGFLAEDDLEMFKLLLNVSGVGPKAALGVLSSMSANELCLAVLSGDDKMIAKAPGIGKKSAQKIILELKDKLRLEDVLEHQSDASASTESEKKTGRTNGFTDAADEAVQALVALGYSPGEALRAVRKCDLTEAMDVESILKLALKNIF